MTELATTAVFKVLAEEEVTWGTWVAQSEKHLPQAQVMILGPEIESHVESASPSPTLPTCTCPLSQIKSLKNF